MDNMFPLIIVLLVLQSWPAVAQIAMTCRTLPNGCDKGQTHRNALFQALARFDATQFYGGFGDNIIFASALDNGALAQISYSCMDGTVPPTLDGATIWTG